MAISKELAKKIKAAEAKAERIVGVTRSCSAAGEELAEKNLSRAGAKLGSLSCKKPARSRKAFASKRGKSGVKKKKKK